MERVWTEERLDMLRKLYLDEDKTVDEIAKEMGLIKGSIQGALSVYKISKRNKKHKENLQDKKRKAQIKRIILKASGIYLP